MHWFVKPEGGYMVFDRVYRAQFLWLPTKIGNEYRWLCLTGWREFCAGFAEPRPLNHSWNRRKYIWKRETWLEKDDFPDDLDEEEIVYERITLFSMYIVWRRK